MGSIARILVLDDEEAIRLFLEEELTHSGYEVVAVDSGAGALEQIAAQEFDLALIDLKLKGIGGMEVLKALRHRWPDTEVIVLTAHASLETSVEALRRGAHDYLFKPCKTVELRESVRTALFKRRQNLRQRALLIQLKNSLSRNLEEIEAAVVETTDELLPELEESTGAQARFLAAGGLIVDMTRHIITLEGHLLELSPTEFGLLAYLVSQAPRVVSPPELVRQVQGYVSEPWEARDVVRSHIHHIRRKMHSATGRTDIIQTVRGVGYTIAG